MLTVAFYILYIYYEIVQIVQKQNQKKGLTKNYNLHVQSVKGFTKSSSNWSKQKAPSRALIISSKTSVVLIKSQLLELRKQGLASLYRRSKTQIANNRKKALRPIGENIRLTNKP